MVRPFQVRAETALTRRALLALIASGAFVDHTQQQPAGPNFSAVASLMRDRVASGVPSIAIAVAQHGRIVWEEAIGMSDRERNISATVHTPSYLASTALLELVEHHEVNLGRPVNDYLRTAKVSSPMWDFSKATVRRVANHTAGLARFVQTHRSRVALTLDVNASGELLAKLGAGGAPCAPPVRRRCCALDHAGIPGSGG
jgi:CubicO group peptidase (beta-lactamase class C family)